MSNATPLSGDMPASPKPDAETSELENTTPVTTTGLRLPDPLPDGTNPFEVISWLLFTAYVAARDLTHAREEKVRQLGRVMRAEEVRGVLTLHWEDDVDRRSVDRLLSDRLLPWHGALRSARNLCAEFRIPLGVYDPLLKAAEDKMDDLYAIIEGRCSDKEIHYYTDLERRISELADSTTPKQLQSPVPPLAAVAKSVGTATVTETDSRLSLPTTAGKGQPQNSEADDKSKASSAKLDAMPERCRKAYRHYLRGVAHFRLTDPTDQIVYDTLESWEGFDETLPDFQTWARYLREARKQLEEQKHKPRTRPNLSEVRSAVPMDGRDVGSAPQTGWLRAITGIRFGRVKFISPDNSWQTQPDAGIRFGVSCAVVRGAWPRPMGYPDGLDDRTSVRPGRAA